MPEKQLPNCANSFCSSLSDTSKNHLCKMKANMHFRRRKEYCLRRNKLFLITKGTMITVRTNIEGKRQGIDYLHEGDILGLTSLFNTVENKDDLCIYTFTNCEVCAFALQDFNENSLYPDIVLAILKNATRHLGQVIKILNYVSLDSSKDRVLNMLDLILNSDTSNFAQQNSPAVPHSHEELAMFFGLNRVTTTRAIDNLKKQGLLNAGRRNIKKM